MVAAVKYRYRVKRDVTTEECPWLTGDIKEGTIVYYCQKPSYGVVSDNGWPVTFKTDGDYPFFELPNTALELFSDHMEEAEETARKVLGDDLAG